MKLMQDAIFIIAMTVIATLFVVGILFVCFMLGTAFIMPLKYLFQQVQLGSLNMYYAIIFGIAYCIFISLSVMTILGRKLSN